MSKFTAGKWEARPNRVIANGRPLAIVNGGNSANTRLIAAAPKMYAIVEWVASLAENQRATNAIIQEARELIKRVDDLRINLEAEHECSGLHEAG